MAFEEAAEIRRATASVQTVHDADGLTLFSSTPQSKAGFAPFAIGFTLFAIILYGGSSGVVLNPARMIGPAIFSGVWDYCYIYWLGEFSGACLAAVTVVYGIQSSYHDIEPNINVTGSVTESNVSQVIK